MATTRFYKYFFIGFMFFNGSNVPFDDGALKIIVRN
jgi:hypothetical protein